jgi:hypothetical protein
VKLGFSSPSAFENENSSLNGGLTLKLLFPVLTLILLNFNGTVSTNILGNAELTNANANLNIAYTGNFANSFTNTGDYTRSVLGI